MAPSVGTQSASSALPLKILRGKRQKQALPYNSLSMLFSGTERRKSCAANPADTVPKKGPCEGPNNGAPAWNPRLLAVSLRDRASESQLSSKSCCSDNYFSPLPPSTDSLDVAKALSTQNCVSDWLKFPYKNSKRQNWVQGMRRTGTRSNIPILIELAATIFVQGLPEATLTDGFFDMKSWLTSLAAESKLPLWMEVLHTLSDHSGRVPVQESRLVQNICGSAYSVSPDLVSDVGTISTFCTSVTRKYLRQLGGNVRTGMVAANAWRQGQATLAPVNLFKIAQFFIAWIVWNQTKTREAQTALNEAFQRIQESSSSTTDEAGSAIVERFLQMMQESQGP